MSLPRLFVFCTLFSLVACGGGGDAAPNSEPTGPLPVLQIEGVDVVGSTNEPMTVTVDDQPDEDGAPQQFQVPRPLSVEGVTGEPFEIRLDYADEAGNDAQHLIIVSIE